MECRFCEVWSDTPSNLRSTEKEDGRLTHKRFCARKEEWVNPEAQSCRFFQLNDKFYCQGNGEFVYVDACIKRASNGTCKPCSDEQMIISYYRSRRSQISNNLKINKKGEENGRNLQNTRLVLR